MTCLSGGWTCGEIHLEVWEERILVKRMRSNHYRQITVDLVMEPSRSSEREYSIFLFLSKKFSFVHINTIVFIMIMVVVFSPSCRCCNSCDDLKAAYTAKGWGFNNVLKTSEQCLRDKTNPFAAVRNGEGCRVYGSMVVNRVAGNFHIAHGESVVRDGRHIHQFIPAEAPQFNISHTVNSITFGEEYPGMPPGLMDNTTRIYDKETGTGLQQYFIKVIPTQYRDWGINTNQFTMTEKFRPMKSINDKGETVNAVLLPGVFFIYDLSPFLIEVSSTSVPFYHLITRIFAIVGGVFVVLGVVDSILYRVQQKYSKNR